MIASVWNQAARSYDYYEAPGDAESNRVNAPKPLHLRTRSIGTVPADAAWPLPAGAVSMGSGPLARGRVATVGGQSSLSGLVDGSLTKAALLGLAGYLLWRYVK